MITANEKISDIKMRAAQLELTKISLRMYKKTGNKIYYEFAQRFAKNSRTIKARIDKNNYKDSELFYKYAVAVRKLNGQKN